MPRMCIAQVSAAIEAFCHGIAGARIADGVLNIRYFDNAALHALALYFDLQDMGKANKRRTLALSACNS